MQNFTNMLSSFNYHKLIDKPTRIVKERGLVKSATLIDNIYTNSNDWDKGLNGLLHLDQSIGLDHKAIFTIIPIEITVKKSLYRTQRDFSKQNIASLNKTLKNKNWIDLYNIASADEACTFFINYVTHMFYICCPEKNLLSNI